MDRKIWITKAFTQHFTSTPDIICHAPGRVNLIGEHTDYNAGFVLPAAINFGTDIAAKKRTDNIVRIVAVDLDSEVIDFNLEEISYNPDSIWINYVAGTLKILREVFPHFTGAELVVSGNVPQGTGLSSSASFEIAVLKTFAQLHHLALDGVKAALIGQQAENTFVGCNCGIMDQLVSALGKQSHAMLLDCQSLRYQYANIPDNLALIIVNSNVKRGLVDSEYNTRREQCEQVAKYFNKPTLRAVSLADLQANQAELSPVLFRRAMHVITENIRTEKALQALNNNDMKMMSKLMQDSHLSMKNDFQITTTEIDYLVEIVAQELGEYGGVRMTGGGFGGCVVALAPHKMTQQITEKITRCYKDKTGLTADIFVCSTTNGAFYE
ncbi:galactokinase [Thalassotalea castellviae]|uniref:Galactokinase n=1 Tax=Thalassotalea castellviae TaxID=3075612 RepID=A0ABU3A318_9GAMM|nr:galactokinase [Thalassotalea sp. W431]MDT0604364.1 galactokinase [Thalassotalea sp. W431]